MDERWLSRFREFTGVKGTGVYEAYRDGHIKYESFVLEKP
jgi:hypothetical protein